MHTISEVMTHGVTVISPTDNLQQAAQMMKDWNVGALPVCEGKRLVGMITDRDITIRAAADGKSPSDVRVAEVMTDQVLWCFEDQRVGEVMQQMGDRQIRRIPVLNHDMQLVGIISLGDLATRQIRKTHWKRSLPHPNQTGAARTKRGHISPGIRVCYIGPSSLSLQRKG